MKKILGFIGLLAFVPVTAVLPQAASAKTPIRQQVQMHAAGAQDFSAQTRRRHRRARVLVYPQQPAAWPYPRPGDVSYPGPGALRDCQAYYATENRPSGTVITPQMRCRWVR